jgi:hypothetical protein
MLDRDMVTAWLEAARELEIRVVAPYEVRLADGATIEVEAYLPDFGGPNGAIAVPLHDVERGELASHSQHFVSQVGDSYRSFERTHFIDTLDDWGWHGPVALRPAWYSGKPWG